MGGKAALMAFPGKAGTKEAVFLRGAAVRPVGPGFILFGEAGIPRFNKLC